MNSALTDFLLARIAEDEAGARAANEQWPGPWTYTRRRSEVWHSGKDFGAYDRPFVCNADGHLADEHIARHNPARVLAECEVRRRVVEVHAHNARWDDGALGDQARATLELLALPYVDHPDYREEWKP